MRADQRECEQAASHLRHRRREGHQHGDGPVFLFQAEDGIRDLYVTGVQTCALPISQRFGHTGTVAQPNRCVGLVGTYSGSYSHLTQEKLGTTVINSMSCTGTGSAALQ